MNVFIAFSTGNRQRMVSSMGQRNHQPTSHCRGVSNGIDHVDLLNRYRCQSLVKPSTCGCRTRADRSLQSSVNLRRRDEGTVGFDKPALIASGTMNVWRRDVLRLSVEKSFQPNPRPGFCSIGENEANTLHRQRAPCSSRGNAIGSVTVRSYEDPADI